VLGTSIICASYLRLRATFFALLGVALAQCSHSEACDDIRGRQPPIALRNSRADQRPPCLPSPLDCTRAWDGMSSKMSPTNSG